MVRLSPKRPRVQGFSMVELMLVLAVVGILSAMIAPGLNNVLADTRAGSAAEQLVRLNRIVRARVRETALAHMVRFSAAGSNDLGRVVVLEGMNNHCNTTPWAEAIAGHAPVEILDMAEFNPLNGTAEPKKSDVGRHVITLTARQMVGPIGTSVATPRATLDICYQPNGLVFRWLGGSAYEPLGRPVLFTIDRTVSTTRRGVPRQVIFPAGGNARIRT